MNHHLHATRLNGEIAVVLSIPCSKEAFDEFVKAARKSREEGEKGLVVNQEEHLELFFKRGEVALTQRQGSKTVTYDNAYVGIHDIFGYVIPETTEEWSDSASLSGGDVDGGKVQAS